MTNSAALTDAYRLIRAHFASITKALSGSFTHRSPQKWRELAESARAIAEECDRAARLLENPEHKA